MPTSNASNVDWVQVVIAIATVIALLQPWMISWWKKIFRKSKIQCVRNKTMFVYFKDDGLFLSVFFTFVAKNADEVITNAKIEIAKKDKKLYKLEWFRFSDPANNSFVAQDFRITQQSNIDAYPLYLVNNVPRILTVYFTDDELRNELAQCTTKDDAMTKMLLTKGEYSLDLSLIDAKGKATVYKYAFSISDDQYSALKHNVSLIYDTSGQEKNYSSFIVELHDRKDEN